MTTLSESDRNMAMFCHLSSLAGLFIPVPGANLAGPLIIWMMKKDESEFVNDHGKEAINFQITMLIAAMISAALIMVLIGFILLPIVGVVALVFTILATVKANQGNRYRYPLSIRFIK